MKILQNLIFEIHNIFQFCLNKYKSIDKKLMGNTINSSKNTNQQTLKIQITDKYSIKCSYIDSNQKETPIQLHNKSQQEEYNLFSSIEFTQELFTNPQDFKLYNIELYGKEYGVIAEVLFALIIS